MDAQLGQEWVLQGTLLRLQLKMAGIAKSYTPQGWALPKSFQEIPDWVWAPAEGFSRNHVSVSSQTTFHNSMQF